MKLCSKGSRHPSNLLTAPEEGSHLPNFDFSFANVTSWNESVQQFFLDSGMRCFLIQEHRLLRPAFQRLSVFFRSKGFHLTSVPARATEQGGASGGVFIATHHSIQSRPGPQVGSGPSWTAAWVRLARVQLAVVSIYLKDGEGVYGDVNARLLAELAAFLRTQAGPWVVAGDWNCSPQELASSFHLLSACQRSHC